MKKKLLLVTLLSVAFAQAQNAPLAQVQIETPGPSCNLGDCITLNTNISIPLSSTSYAVSSIDYIPIFPFTGGTILDNSSDDVWSPTVNLPFNFCFYGNTYNQLVVGSNGVVSFNTNSGDCPWEFTQTIPTPAFPIKNAIYGVYQDTNIAAPPVTNPLVQNVNYYLIDTGIYAAPNRAFIINFNQLPLYNCGTSLGLQTSQIIIHEGTNIIDVYVQNRDACTAWNSGSGLIGIQNQTGTQALTPPARNTGTWSATHEAWRFTPNGAPLSAIYQWSVDGNIISGFESNTAVVCPTENGHIFGVDAAYVEAGTTFVLHDEYTFEFTSLYNLTDPLNISVCTNDTGVYVANIDQTAEILSVQPADEYEIKYYQSFEDAQNGSNNFITDLANYSFTTNSIVVVRIENVVYGCTWIRSFALVINPSVPAPIGAANQGFNPGQTLNDLVVEGQSIQWYDAAIGGNLLPGNTLLQNNFTYYASQTVNNCESRMSNPVRLAVHVYDLTLSNVGFLQNNLKVYPNPTHQFLTISNSYKIEQVIVRNSLGQKVLEVYPNQKEYTLNTTQLLSGIYMLDIKSEKQSQTLKVVKN